MKHYTDEELKQILSDIITGTTYCGVTKGGCGTGKIYLTLGKYIEWEHYGSSAEKCNIAQLRFILEEIFNDCEFITPAEWSDYHINYIPIDKQYKGFDLSMMHPNVLGV